MDYLWTGKEEERRGRERPPSYQDTARLPRLDDSDVARRERAAGVQRRDELCRVSARAIVVVIELPGRSVVDEAIVGIVAARSAGSRVEARVGRREVARRAGRGELVVVEGEMIRAAREVADAIGVGRAELAEHEAVVACAAEERIDAPCTGQCVVAVAALELIGVGVAGDVVVEA